MGKILTTRLPEKFVKNLKKISEVEEVDTSTTVRKLLSSAIAEWKKNYAVEQYKKGEFSFGQLAEFAEISVWDVPELLKQKKVPLNYDEEELAKDIKLIEEW